MTGIELDTKTEALLVLAAKGDELAFDHLMGRHRERLRRMIKARMDHRMRARLDASDVVQEALVVACLELGRYVAERPLPFYPWLFRLASDQLARARRQHVGTASRTVRREHSQPADASAGPLIDGLMDSGTSPSGSFRREEKRQRVRQALAALGDADREVLVLRYVEDLPFAEVAARLGIKETAAKVRHYRALERIRELLDGESLG